MNFDALSKSDKGGSMPELQEDDPLEIKSIKSELSHKGKDIFVDQKNLKKMQLEKSQKFSHIVTTVVKDKQNSKF